MKDPRVDWSNDMRPGVMGGECSRCFHVDPLHEPGCVRLSHQPDPCACRDCVREELNRLHVTQNT